MKINNCELETVLLLFIGIETKGENPDLYLMLLSLRIGQHFVCRDTVKL